VTPLILYRDESAVNGSDAMNLCNISKYPNAIPPQGPTWTDFVDLNTNIEKADFDFTPRDLATKNQNE